MKDAPRVVLLAIHTVLSDVAGGVSVQGHLTHTAPQTTHVPHGRVDHEEVALRDGEATPVTYVTALTLKLKGRS